MNEINQNLKFKSGVYCIINTINGKRYIGSSSDIYSRLNTHIYHLRSQKSHNKHLQASWNKYGESAFECLPIEYCTEEIRFEREQYYISCFKPEFNLTENVISNFGHSCEEETRKKISKTLKEKYASGEITTFMNEQNWIKCYIYDITNYSFIKECKNISEANLILYGKKMVRDSKTLFKTVINNQYCVLSEKLYGLDLVNYIDKNFKYNAGNFGRKYLVVEDKDGNFNYYRTANQCANRLKISRSMIMKHQFATKDNPYIPIKAPNFKIYYTYDFIPHAVLTKELEELLSGNIGEKPEKENPEINLENKESKSSYSVESETYANTNI